MLITVCVIAYNEEKTINNILKDITNQDYNHSKMEIILVDGKSTDKTKSIMNQFCKEHREEFYDVIVLDNEKKSLPAGWNVALRKFRGDAIVKVDAHASIPSDFIAKNIEELESGEYITGGQRPCMVDDTTPFKETLLLAETSMFGAGVASYRRNPGKKYVDSMFHAAYRREVFQKTGFFNENLLRTEDNEMHYRMRKNGFKLAFCPEIVSYQHIRSSLWRMMKQKYSNGYWIGLTSGVCPKCLSTFHFVPFLFVFANILSVIGLVIFKANTAFRYIILMLTKVMWIMYVIADAVMTVTAVIGAGKKRNKTNAALPFIFPLLHISYGMGTLAGLVKLPVWLREKKQKNIFDCGSAK